MRLTPLFLAVFFSSLISIGSVEDLNIDTDPSGGLFSNDVPADNQPDSSSLALSTTYQVEDDQTANYLDGEQPLASGSSDEHTLGVLISDDCPPGSNTPTRRSKIARGSGVCNTPYSLQRSGPEGSGGTQNGGQRQNEGDQTTNGYSKPLEKEPVPQINLKLCPRGIFHDFNIPVCHDGVDKETFEDKDWTQLNNGHLRTLKDFGKLHFKLLN